MLDVYGSLFYAGARTLQARLPDPTGTESPIVILRLRGRTTFGATFFKVIGNYAQRLDAVDGRLFISGVDPSLVNKAAKVGDLAADGPFQVFGATELLGESTHRALEEADAWIVCHGATPAERQRSVHPMNEAAILALALVVFVWAILSEPLSALDLSAPLVFLVAGFLLGNSSWGIVGVNIESSTVHALAEITLALLLFADASTVPIAAARRDVGLISRLLGIGLPLSIVAGSAVALLLYPSIPLALAVLIGASLAPTDAALERVGHRRRASARRRPAGAERRERAQRRHRHSRGDGEHRSIGNGARDRRTRRE